jgi:acetolactate synthase-1/2/3 large subunit
MTPTKISETLAAAIAEAGGDTVFGMPGGGNNLDFIGASEAAGLRFVLAHAETNAAIMAAVYADLTRRPTACVVTRGPGAASAVNGVANAKLDRQPLIVVADAVDSKSYERISHQRLDQLQLFAPVSKWVATLGAGATHETAAAAVALSMQAPSGPVFLNFDPQGPASALPTTPAPGEVTVPGRVHDAIRSSRRPVVLLGTGARVVAGPVREVLQGTGVPVLTTYRAKGVVPESWPEFAGILTGATTEAPILEAADLILMIGVDTVEFIPNAWPYNAPVVSLSAWPEDSPYLTIGEEIVGDLAALTGSLRGIFQGATWPEDAVATHRRTELERLVAGPPATTGIAPAAVIQRAREAAPAGTIATVDAGAHMLPAMELWAVENEDEVLISSGLATMGFSVPAAVGAAFARPDRRVLAFIGDGGLAMCLGEIETLARYRLNVTVVVFNDARLSLIAIKARPDGNGGENAIAFSSVNFAEMARAYGIAGFVASTESELDEALSKALATDGPSLVDARVDPSAYPHILNSIRGRR